jgi:hypothetical protein
VKDATTRDNTKEQAGSPTAYRINQPQLLSSRTPLEEDISCCLEWAKRSGFKCSPVPQQPTTQPTNNPQETDKWEERNNKQSNDEQVSGERDGVWETVALGTFAG